MAKQEDKLQLGPVNFIILGAAVVVLIVGFIVMTTSEITISPILVSAALAVLIPLGLLYKSKPKD